jgi:hypothetical protein
MKENRREFIGHLTAGTLMATLSSGFMLEGCSTSWVTTALNDLPVIVNIATTIATIVADALGGGIISPAVAAIIKTAAGAVQAGLALAQQLISDYNANPSASIIAKIKQALVDVQAQLTNILQAAHIDNAALQATIAGAIGLAITVVTAIMSLLPAVTTGGAMTAPRAAIKPLTPSQIKAQFDSILTENGYGKYAL